MKSRITELLGIKYPIFQGGMAWVADGDLAGAVSNAGGLGIIGGGNAPKEVVKANIDRVKQITDKPFGVNIMLLSPFVDDIVDLVIEEGVKVVTTGAGNPEKYMKMWKEAGVKVIPVVASVALAKRMERCGADALVAEGCEAGGHIGESTTMVLVPQIVDAVNIPVKNLDTVKFRLLLPEELQTEEESPPHLCWEQKVFRWEHILSLQMNPRYMRITKKESSKRRILIPK